MKNKTALLLKIAKIGTALSSLTLIIPGDVLFSEDVPMGIAFIVSLFFGFVGLLSSLIFFGSATYLILSGFRKWDNNFDDAIVIIIMLGAFIGLFTMLDQYIEYGDRGVYITTTIFLVFSLSTLILSAKRLLARYFF